MTVSWDRIQDALAAAIRGDELRPVVSQRTLFGIPSSVEVQMARLTAEMERERASAHEACGLEGGAAEDLRTAELREAVSRRAAGLGGSAVIGRGMRYFIFAGGEAGFDIPAYPFDPKGELADFFRDRGVRNLPEYYASLGVPAERYEQVQTHALLVLREEDGERGLLLKGAELCDASRVLPLCESGFVGMCDARSLESLASFLGVGGEA